MWEARGLFCLELHLDGRFSLSGVVVALIASDYERLSMKPASLFLRPNFRFSAAGTARYHTR